VSTENPCFAIKGRLSGGCQKGGSVNHLFDSVSQTT